MDRFEVQPVTAQRWEDLAALFGAHGAYSGCWCMWWRLTGQEFSRGNASNRAGLKQLVDAGRVPGLLAYREGAPVGWVSLGPREDFGRILRSPTLKPVDEQPAWSIVCFYIAKTVREQGVATRLLQAAIEYAAAQGASALEAYPVDTGESRAAQTNIFTGALEMFQRAGFEEIARRSPARPIVRLRLK